MMTRSPASSSSHNLHYPPTALTAATTTFSTVQVFPLIQSTSHTKTHHPISHTRLSPSLSFHSQMKPTTLSLPLLLLLLSALPPSFSDSSDDQPVLDCVPKHCGTVTNISYPFWVSGQQHPYCGFPEFELHCDANTLFLQTPDINYFVQNIFYANHSILVVPEFDPGLPNSECPLYHNLSFNLTPFTVSATNMDLFIIYYCTVPLQPFLYKAPCTGHSFFTILGSNSSELEPFEWPQTCEIVEIPVLGFPGANASDYTRPVKYGFLLEWSVAECSDCSSSGGQCGYSIDRNGFMCICNDRIHSRRCNATRSKVKQIAIGVGVGGGILVMCFICCIWYYRRRIMRQPSSSSKFLIRTGSCNADQEMCSNSYRTHVFSYAELHEATNGFDESRELGDGGFGTVYKGQLRDGRVVAVKRLYENNYKRVEQFLNEVDILSRLRHKNLVTLYGCTSRHSRELLLVYEFVANGTVADHLHGPRAPENGLTWGARLNIAIETADALAYLHAIEPQIIHRDVKTNNILLDNSFHVKVADFGLSRLFPVDATHVSTLPQGTPGYVDPEYHQCYQLTDKSDVYSFGVVLVELISSMPAVDISRHRNEINLANLAVTKIQNREIEQLVDPRLAYREDWEIEKMINMVAELAFRCLQGDRDMRPTIKEVLGELKQIENKGEKVAELGEIGDDARLLKNEVPYSPDTVTVRWDSKTTTPNTSA